MNYIDQIDHQQKSKTRIYGNLLWRFFSILETSPRHVETTDTTTLDATTRDDKSSAISWYYLSGFDYTRFSVLIISCFSYLQIICSFDFK